MTHLNEEELVDVVLGESRVPEHVHHLSGCDACSRKLETLKSGLAAIRAVDHGDFRISRPLTHRHFWQRLWGRRFLAAAAAVLIGLSILGFRVEIEPSGVAIQFDIIRTNQSPSVAALEKRLKDAEQRFEEGIQIHAAMNQAQLEERFNAIYMERGQELQEFGHQVQSNLVNLDENNALMVAALRNDLYDALKKESLKGTIQ